MILKAIVIGGLVAIGLQSILAIVLVGVVGITMAMAAIILTITSLVSMFIGSIIAGMKSIDKTNAWKSGVGVVIFMVIITRLMFYLAGYYATFFPQGLTIASMMGLIIAIFLILLIGAFGGFVGWKTKRIKMIEQPAVSQISFKQPILNLVLLYVFTFGIYAIYWFYRNWKHMKIHKNLDISPGWRTVGLCVPIYNIVLVYEHLRDIRDFARETSCETYSSPGWLTAGYLVLTGLSSLLTWKLPNPYSLLAWVPDLLFLWILIIVQRTLNGYWGKEQIGLPERTEFSGIEIAVLIIGGIILILSFIGVFIPE